MLNPSTPTSIAPPSFATWRRSWARARTRHAHLHGFPPPKAVDQVSGEVFDKGVEKGQRELLLDQLTERFGSLPASVTERIAQASRQDLKRWGSRILKSASLDDVFASA
jgi:hypothetical protein